jgi:hypothetical protein
MNGHEQPMTAAAPKKSGHRCRRNVGVKVYAAGGAGLDNAEVLCRICYAMNKPESGAYIQFEEKIEQKALERALYQCECTSTKGCH